MAPFGRGIVLKPAARLSASFSMTPMKSLIAM
jgi:hypothetical protein